MKKTRTKRNLNLATQTVRRLTGETLRLAAGGATQGPCAGSVICPEGWTNNSNC